MAPFVDILQGSSFSQANVDALVAALASSGIGVYAHAASAQLLTPIPGVASPMRLLSWQAHNLALEISAGNGRAGAALDGLVPDQSTAGVPPPSYLLAGYVVAATTPGGALARALMAGQDLYQPEHLRFPALIPLLFAADLARDAAQQRAGLTLLSAHPRASAPTLKEAAGICSSIQQFVDGTINAVFGALETEAAKVVDQGGNVLRDVWDWLQGAVDKLKSIAKWVAQQLTAPVVRIIRSIAGVLAIAGQVVSALQPWTVRMEPNPSATRFGIGDETVAGTIKARVDVGLLDDWPPDVLDCAQQSGVTLPPLKPKGDPISWSLTQTPIPLVQPGDEPASLDDNVEAMWVYVTNDESEEVARGDPRYGVLRVAARVKRPELEHLKDQFVQLLFAQLPDLIARILQPILGPQITSLLSRLTGILASEGIATVSVTYHAPKATPTPAAAPAAVGVTLNATGPHGQVLTITAHACAGAISKWSGTMHLVDSYNDFSVPIAWAFPPGGTTTTTIVGPVTEQAESLTLTAVIHFTIVLVLDRAGTPSALVFHATEDLAGYGSGAFDGLFSNFGTPIPLTQNIGKLCG